MYDIEFWAWPTQIFGLVAADSYNVLVDPRHHVATIILTYCLTYGGNILLYNLVGAAIYVLFARLGQSQRMEK